MKRVGLKQGDVLFLDEENTGTLKIITTEQAKEKPAKAVEINADLCVDPRMLTRVLAGNYMLGYNLVKVVSSTRLGSKQVEEIRKVTHELMGISIMEETPNMILLQCLMDVVKFSIHTLIRRLYIIASTMHKEATDSFIHSDASLAKDTIRRKEAAETMFWVIVRLLNTVQKDKTMAAKMDMHDSMLILWYRFVAQCLRLLGDWARKIAENVIALEKNRDVIGEYLVDEILKINQETSDICQMAMESLFSSDVDLANKAIEAYGKIQKKEEDLQQNICNQVCLPAGSSMDKYFKDKGSLEPCTIAQLSVIIWSIRRIAELGSEIAEIAIHKALSKQTRLCKEVSGAS